MLLVNAQEIASESSKSAPAREIEARDEHMVRDIEPSARRYPTILQHLSVRVPSD